MRYRKLTPTGDYSFGNGQKDFYHDVPQAVGQAAQTRVLLWLGEWFLNVDEGTPFMQSVIGTRPSLQQLANATISARIAGTQGILNVNNFQSVIDPATRRIQMSCDIDTIYGATQVEIDSRQNL